MHIYIVVMVLVLVNTTYQQTMGPEREFCKAVQENEILEKALPLIRRHLEAETESSKLQMDEVNAELTAVKAELEATKEQNNAMNVSLEAVKAELETTKQRNNAMNVSLEAVKAKLETTKQRNNAMNVSLEAVKAELENIKRRYDNGLKGLTSCSDVTPGSPSGIYTVTLTPGRSDDVYCDMDTDGGPWTVIQNRQDGTVDFYRNWTEYQTGFGDLDGEFWAGLNIIHLLTQNGSILRINLMSWKNDTQYAEYQDFRVGDESSKYRLSVSGFSGNATYDGMGYDDGDQFTTYDNDNDVWGGGNCAVDRHGAWWYRFCSHSNLNGPYVQDTGDDWESMWWWEFYSGRYNVPMMRSRMMVKHPGV
ncbi:fibrinogen-like protein A [Argopecten irradians]|uniref:fibrinogen-like protein A n=1 Tax=Argopecten irradians TaxID=31199 RepID=UPI00371E4F35